MTDIVSDIEPPPEPLPLRRPLHDRSLPLLAAFLLIAAIALAAAWISVFKRPPEGLASQGGAKRANVVVMRWIDDGYWHYAGLMVRHPTKLEVYRSSTGAYMLSLLFTERIAIATMGHYSWQLAALHNEIVSMLLAALAALLAFRLTRRMGLPPRLAFVAGAAVTLIVFTFPDNLALYWEMSAQAYFAIFALLFLLIHERCIDERRTRFLGIAQALAAFVMTLMEPFAAAAFVAGFGATVLMLEQDRRRWKRFILLAALPFIAAMALANVQQKVAAARFPAEALSGSQPLFRSGLDGESLYYGDHLDIAMNRGAARNNWKENRQYLFRWKWVFILGVGSTLALIAAYMAGRAPRIIVETFAALIGSWLFYAAVFSQAVVIHPYLYDVLLFVPLAIAAFALGPALAESMTRRSGAIILIVMFCAAWYAMFQMRLYALRFPAPDAKAAPPPVVTP
jgi:hypothetical protein